MIVSVIGFGHVGSVVGSVLADRGCKVYGIDKNIDLITSFKKGLSPINEPGLQKLITNGLEKKKLIITDSLESISKSKMIIITVGTPLNKKYLPMTILPFLPIFLTSNIFENYVPLFSLLICFTPAKIFDLK